MFRQLREHYKRHDRLRLIADYQKQFLDSFVRDGDEEAKPRASENADRLGALESGQDVANHFPVNIRQPAINSVVTESELLVIDAELMQHRGVKVVAGGHVLLRLV